jgi:hypothetical protein
VIRALFLPLFGLVTLPALCQQIVVTVSPIPTGALSRTARRTVTHSGLPSGIAIRSVQVCGPANARVGSTEIIQSAARSNALLFSPGSIDLLAIRKSLAEVSADIGELAGLAGAFVTGSNAIKMKPSDKTVWVTSTAGAGLFFHWLASKLSPAPATTPATIARLRAYELPTEITVPPGGCWNGTALGSN